MIQSKICFHIYFVLIINYKCIVFDHGSVNNDADFNELGINSSNICPNKMVFSSMRRKINDIFKFDRYKRFFLLTESYK